MNRIAGTHEDSGDTHMVSIILLEPNVLLKEKIAGVLARNERVWCVVQVNSRADLTRAVDQLYPDFILADMVALKGTTSVQILGWRMRCSRLFALVDTFSEQYEREAVRLGFHGLIEKSHVEDEMLREIQLKTRAREASDVESD